MNGKLAKIPFQLSIVLVLLEHFLAHLSHFVAHAVPAPKEKSMQSRKSTTLLLPIISAGVLLALGNTPAHTATADKDPLAALQKCRTLSDTSQKAACYDIAMDRLEADRAANKISIITGTQIEGLQRDAFGFNLPSLPRLRLGRALGTPGKNALSDAQDTKAGKILKKSKSGEVLRVAYTVSRVSILPNGRKRIYLTDGQVWEQVGSDAPRFRGSAPYKVQIKKASMGSYLLAVEGSRRTVRIRRIK
jgi:hypothetical protein